MGNCVRLPDTRQGRKRARLRSVADAAKMLNFSTRSVADCLFSTVLFGSFGLFFARAYRCKNSSCPCAAPRTCHGLSRQRWQCLGSVPV